MIHKAEMGWQEHGRHKL